MKPFSLQEFLDGKKVATRSGKEIIKLTYHPNANYECQMCGWDNKGYLYIWGGNGKINSLIGDSPNDLMMVSEKKSAWINIYKSKNGILSTQLFHETEKEARDFIADKDGYVTTTKIEWEE